MTDRTRDWVAEGFALGDKAECLLFCSTLNGIPYFIDDAPVPLVGQDDVLQPKYEIFLSTSGDGDDVQLDRLGEFLNKDSMDKFGDVLAEVMNKRREQDADG